MAHEGLVSVLVKAAKAGGMEAHTEQLVPQFPKRSRTRRDSSGFEIQVEEDAFIDVEGTGVHEACELLIDASVRHPTADHMLKIAARDMTLNTKP